MAIQPRFAQAILSGDKHVEFRKRRLAGDIDTVLIYETAPTRSIIGQFTIARTVEATPTALWREFRSVGGIARSEFLGYYAGRERGVGLIVKDTRRYQRLVSLSDLSVAPTVPQSFVYLPASILEEIASMQPTGAVTASPGSAGRPRRTPRHVLAGIASC